MANLVVYASLNQAALNAGIVQANAKIGTLAKNITAQGAMMQTAFGVQLGRAAMRLAAYGTLFAGLGLVSQIVKVRGQFQQLQIAFETMLDSKVKADKMMSDSLDLALKTPFTLMEVTTNAKQLMAMGVSFEKVMGTLKNLGDVAAGVSVPLSRIAINYGQVLTLGRLQMREIRDFAMAGVPLIPELAKNLNKTTAEVTKMVSAGKIGFKDVEEAFRTMSSEGGKFYNLMEKQNKSITGQISNLKDKWQVAMNEIGQKEQGFIYDSIKGVSYMITNFRSIMDVMLDLIALYGIYRAALILTNSVKLATNAAIYMEEGKALALLIPTQAAAVASKQGMVVGSAAYTSAIITEIAAEGKRLQTVYETTAAEVLAKQAKAEAAIARVASATAIMEENAAELKNAEIKLQSVATNNLVVSSELKAKLSKQGLIEGTIAYSAAINAEIIAEGKLLASIAASSSRKVAAAQVELAAKTNLLAVKQAELKLAIEGEVVDGVRLKGSAALANVDLQRAATIAVKTAAIDANIAAEKVALLTEEKRIAFANAALIPTEKNIAAATVLSTATKEAKIAADNLATLTTQKDILVGEAKVASTLSVVAAEDAATFATNVNTASKSANVTVTGMLVAAQNALLASMARLKLAMMNNPFTALAIIVTAVGFAIYKLATADTALEKAEKELQKTLKKTKEERQEAVSDADALLNKIRSETSLVYEKIKAYDELIKRFVFFAKYSEGDIQAMTPEQKASLLQDFNIQTDKSTAQRDYDAQLKIVNDIKKKLDALKDQYSDDAIGEKMVLGLDLEKEQYLLKGYSKELQKVADQVKQVAERDKEATLKTKDIKVQEKYYADKLAGLKAQRDGIDRLMVEENKKPLPDVFSLERSQKSLDGLKTQISATEKVLNGFRETELSGDESFWTARLETATKAQKAINDIQLEKLQKATPEQLKAGLKTGIGDISPLTVKSFIDSEADIKMATARLKIYERAKVDSDQTIENKKQQLLEQRNKNELFAATVLQGKLLKVEEETTRQKLDIAANEYQKNLAQLEKNKLDTLQSLKKLGQEWQPEDEATYQEGIKASEEVFMAAKVEINRQAAEEIDRIWQEVEDYRLTGYEKEKAAIAKKYDEEIKQLKKLFVNEGLLTKEQLNLLRKLKQKQKFDEQKLDVKYALDNLDFELELEYRKNEAKTKGLNKENRLTAANYESWKKFTQAKIDKLKDQTDTESKQQSELLKQDLLIGAEKRKAEQIAEIGTYASQAADSVLYLSETLMDLAEKTGNAKLKAFAEEIGAVGKVIQSAAEGAKNGSWIGAIIGAATSMITQTIDSIATAKAEIYEYQQNQIDFLNAYKGLLLEVKKEDYETIFGISTFDMVAQATKNAKDALERYNEELAKSSGAPILKKQQDFINEYKTLLDAYKKGYTDLQGMAVKTKDYTGWATIWGKRDEYKSLIELAPELWGKDGVFSVEAAKKFLETNTQLSEAQRKIIQNVIDLKDAYEQNMAIIKEDIKDTFGDIGNAATDSIIDAITNSTSAFTIWEDAGSQAIENLGEKLMYELFFADRFKKLQDDLLKTYDLGDPQTIADAQLSLIDQFYGNIGTDMENAQKWGEEWKKKAQEKGFDIWSPEKDEQSKGLSGQIQRTVTEETAGEWVGLVRRESEDIRGIRDYAKIGITNLILIEKNTMNTVNRLDIAITELQAINKNTKGVPTAAF